MCEMIGKYLYLHMKLMVELLPSYSRESGDVICKIDNIHMDDDIWLVSLDVDALYTSIKHKDGIEAATAYFVMNSRQEEQIHFLFSHFGVHTTAQFFPV